MEKKEERREERGEKGRRGAGKGGERVENEGRGWWRIRYYSRGCGRHLPKPDIRNGNRM